MKSTPPRSTIKCLLAALIASGIGVMFYYTFVERNLAEYPYRMIFTSHRSHHLRSELGDSARFPEEKCADHRNTTDHMEYFRSHHMQMEQRRLRIRNLCLEREITSPLNSWKTTQFQQIIDYVWMVIPKHSLFYCALPKCASTSWKYIFLKDMSIEVDSDADHVHRVAMKPFSAMQLLRPKSMIDSPLPLSTANASSLSLHDRMTARVEGLLYHRLLIVRNPWQRLYSAWRDKIFNSNQSLSRFCNKWKEFSDETVTFSEYLECLVMDMAKEFKNAHTHPMVDMADVCTIDYNIIVKMEELTEYIPLLIAKFSFTSNILKGIEQIRNNLSGNKQSDYREHYSGVSKEVIDKLKLIYKLDCIMFDYPEDPTA